jgi:hypothetical protein
MDPVRRFAVRRRRQQEDLSADEVERFFGSLPRVVRELKRGKQRNLFVAVFGLAAVLTLAWRTELQDDQITAAQRQDRVTAFEQCQLVNDNARALNSFVDVAIASVKANETLTGSEKNYRVSLYQGLKQKLPVCADPHAEETP